MPTSKNQQPIPRIATQSGTIPQRNCATTEPKPQPLVKVGTKKIVKSKSLSYLMAKEFPPTRWTVPEILPEGATLLAGAPKMGKSILALNIAIAVATEGNTLGQKVEQPGQVLYLALEDGERRLKERIALLYPIEANNYTDNFCYADEWPTVGDGCEESLVAWLEEHKNAKLIIIDTLKRVKPRTRGNRNSYDVDYESVACFQSIAKKYYVAILIVHHTRKGNSDDVMEDISGSTGLPGAVDNALILKRVRSKNDAILHLFSRDIEEKEMAISLSFPRWTLLGNAQEYKMSAERKAIMEILKEADREMPLAEIFALVQEGNKGATYNSTQVTLYRMSKDGLIDMTRRGHYKFRA